MSTQQRGSVCAETHNELRGLEQKLDELLSRDTTDERQQAMYNALMTKLSEMRLPNSYKCCSTSGETAESIDRLVSLLRQELQQERERSNAEKIEAEKLRRVSSAWSGITITIRGNRTVIDLLFYHVFLV